jgi:hypothetical protein
MRTPSGRGAAAGNGRLIFYEIEANDLLLHGMEETK